MEVEYKFERVDDGHPDQCHAITGGKFRCRNRRVENSDYCMAHGGNTQHNKNKQNEMRNYNLTKWKIKMAEKASSPKLKSLNEEIGILRVVLETQLNRIQNDNDLILESGNISDMIGKIKDTVTACHKIDKDLDNLMDKSELSMIISEIVKAIDTHVEDKEALELVANDLDTIMMRLFG
jgi:hypothetical protein